MADEPCSLCARPEAGHDDAACSMGWTPPLPPLRVWTARVSWRGEGRLDITRKSGTAGLFLAPSWAILRPALDARRAGGAESNALAWARYVPAYVAEMRASYRTNVEAWKELLAAGERTLVCYCTDAAHCHRRLLASMLVKCGAVDMGER